MTYRIDPKKQFSKWLARWTAVFWFLYMSWLSAVMLIAPATGLYCVYMGCLVTAVMVFMTVAYTHNSVAEKMAFAMLDKTRLELSIGGKTNGNDTTENNPDTEGGEG